MCCSPARKQRIEKAIVSEAEAAAVPGGAKSVIAIKDNEERAKELKVCRGKGQHLLLLSRKVKSGKRDAV